MFHTRDKRSSWILNIIAFIIIVFPFWGIHYTNDWEGYSYTFSHPIFSRDLGFSLLSLGFTSYGFEYQDLFKFHILLIAISYLNLNRSVRLNPVILSIVLLIFYYVQIANQIRYYLAYPLILYSTYLLYNKKIFSSLLIISVAFTFHKSVIIVLGIYILYFLSYSINSKHSQIILILLGNLLIGFAVGYIQRFDAQYEEYQTQVSSLLGGIFNSIPLIIAIALIYKFNIIISRKESHLFKNHKYKWLYIISVGTCVFFYAGLQMQVLTNRFIAPLLPIWIGYYMFIKTHTHIKSIDRLAAKYMWTMIICLFLWKFLVTPFLGLDSYISELGMIIESYYL